MEHEGCNSCTESSSMAIKSYGVINSPLPQPRLHAYSVLLITPCPTVLFPAFSLSLTLCLSLSPWPSPHLEGWQTTAGPPPPICPSGQSLFGKLSTDQCKQRAARPMVDVCPDEPSGDSCCVFTVESFPCTAGVFVSKHRP